MIEDFIHNLTLIQIIGTGFGIAQVLLARKNKISNYLFGIVSILLGFWVHYQTQLYADILLGMYYLVMSIYGYVYWRYGKKNKPSPITYSTKQDYIKAGLIVVICFSIMVYWLGNHTDSDVVIWDSIISAFAWAGMWLMARRKIENWVFLNISNLIAIPLLIYKELYIYAGLTLFLFVVAISGYIEWRKIIKARNEQDD